MGRVLERKSSAQHSAVPCCEKGPPDGVFKANLPPLRAAWQGSHSTHISSTATHKLGVDVRPWLVNFEDLQLVRQIGEGSFGRVRGGPGREQGWRVGGQLWVLLMPCSGLRVGGWVAGWLAGWLGGCVMS